MLTKIKEFFVKIKGVLFDLDGTLINYNASYFGIVPPYFVEFGLPVPSKEALVAGFGLPLRTAAKAICPKDDRRFLCCLQ